MMDEKKVKVLEAAKRVFLKYGYIKVTMNDIAREAGISRPALYLIFSGKEQIYNAVIRLLSIELSETVKSESESLSEPMDKLRKVFDVWTFRMYELLNRSEEAKELYQSSMPFAKESMKESVRIFENDIFNALNQFPANRLNSNVTAQELACVFASAVFGLKQNSENLNELENKINFLIRMGINDNPNK